MAKNSFPTAQPDPRTPPPFPRTDLQPQVCSRRLPFWCRPELESRLAVGHPAGLGLDAGEATPHSHSREQVVIKQPGAGRDH
jgi:hypothetical protein